MLNSEFQDISFVQTVKGNMYKKFDWKKIHNYGSSTFWKYIWKNRKCTEWLQNEIEALRVKRKDMHA